MKTALHDTDYYGWIRETAESLRQGRLDEIDLAGLAEEMDELGEALEARLERRFEWYLMHRLKWDYQPGRRTRSWTLTINEQHRQAVRLAGKNPSLRPRCGGLFADAYTAARVAALIETGLDESGIPVSCPFPFAECFPELA